MKRFLSATVMGIALLLPLGAKAQEVMTFGIVPQQSASRLAQMWGPLLAELSARTGVSFRFRTTKDIPTFEACLAAGVFDFAYMNPMHYVIFSGEAGYVALAHQEGKRLKGVMVVHADSSYEDIADLQNQLIAFPSPGAFGASILNRALLDQQSVAFEATYVNSHDSVYRAVASGLADAGGGVTRTWNSVDPSIRDQLRKVYETDAFTPHAIAAHDSVGSDLAKVVQDTLTDAGLIDTGLVNGIGMSGIIAASDSDWDDVRALGMSRNDTGVSEQGDVACPSD